MNSVVFCLSLYSHKLVFLLLRVYPMRFERQNTTHSTRVDQAGAHDDVIKRKLSPRY